MLEVPRVKMINREMFLVYVNGAAREIRHFNRGYLYWRNVDVGFTRVIPDTGWYLVKRTGYHLPIGSLKDGDPVLSELRKLKELLAP